MRTPSSVAARRVLGLTLALQIVAACGAGLPPPNIGQIAAIRPIEGANLLSPVERDVAPRAGEDANNELALANAEFALDVYRDIAARSDGNIIIGPHSISSSLAMLYVGARGSTESDMAGVMHLTGEQADFSSAVNALDLALVSRTQEGVIDLRLANQGFAAPGLPFVASYLETLGRDFGAPMAELDFSDVLRATQVINDWAADRTDGRITGLFPPGTLSENTMLVLANAVSMDAAWKYLFDPAQTTTKPFQRADGTMVDVPTMRFDLYLPLSWQDEYAAVELPYGSGDMSMVLILPEDLDTFEADLSVDTLQPIFDAIREEGIHLSLPKFSFKSHTDLDDTLKDLGMANLYGGADLSGMTSSGLFLETVQHEAFIEVDEEGTEAHAATGTGMAESHGPSITLDRPFFFVIRDRPTGAILFIGRVADPSLE